MAFETSEETRSGKSFEMRPHYTADNVLINNIFRARTGADSVGEEHED